MFLDGQLVAEDQQVLHGAQRTPAAEINLVIGRDDAQPGRFLDGWIAEVAVYDHVLPPQRIQTRYRLGRGGRS
jgi:hypothetical protein